MHSFLRDCRYALRRARNNPGFSLVALLILSLGIGLNTAVFTVVNAVLLRELPYPEARQLVVLHWKNNYGRLGDDVSVEAVDFLSRHAGAFSKMAFIDPTNAGANLSITGAPIYAHALKVSNGFFEVLDVKALIGRTFTSGSTDTPMAVLSYPIWQREFQADPHILGHILSVDGQAYSISGVMPRGFRSYPAADIWIPLNANAFVNGNPQANRFRLIGRLRPNISAAHMQQELDSLADQFRRSYGLQNVHGGLGFQAESYLEYVAGNLRTSLIILSIAVFLVLLIACANLAALMTARSSSRGNELALRLALGASRSALIRLIMTEALIWAAIGGAIGLVLADLSVPLLIEISPRQIQRASEIRIDFAVAAFTLLAAVLTALMCSLAPALSITRSDPKGNLRSGYQMSAGSQQSRLTRWLVAAQVGISTILLGGAGLLLLTFLKTRAITPGFVPDRLTIFQLALTDKSYQRTAETQQLTERILERLETLPGHSSAASVTGIPTERGMNAAAYPLTPSREDPIVVEYRPITKDYFSTMGIPLRDGRPFGVNDRSNSSPVVIVSESLARRWWPKQSPIGQTMAIGDDAEPPAARPKETVRQVVAMSADVHEAGLDHPAPLIAYVPQSQVPDGTMSMINKSFLSSFLVRSNQNLPLDPLIKNIVGSTDPRLPIVSIQPANEILGSSLSNRKFYALMIGIFASFALFLTGVGIFGVLSFQVAQRSQELAIRMALGATRRAVIAMVLRQGLSIVLMGLALGLAGTIAVTKLIRSLLYHTSPYDPSAMAVTSLLILLVGAVASWIPALRASARDPLLTLRSE